MIEMILLSIRKTEDAEWEHVNEKVAFLGWQGDEVLLLKVSDGLVGAYRLRLIQLKANVASKIQTLPRRN